MSVLKGPAAAAMYGARGANGVILITTKSGKKGKRMGVEFNSNFTVENNNVNPTFQNVWGGGYDDNYLSFGKKTVDGEEVAVWPTWLIDHWGGKMDGRPILYEAAPEWGVQALSPQPTDNIAKFYRTGTTLTNTLSVSGGSEKSSVRLSVSDMRNKSIVPHSSLDRQTISLRASSQISEKIFVDAKVDYIRQTGENRVQNGVQLMNLPSTLKIWPRSLSLEVAKQYEREDGRMLNYRNASPFNPYWLTEKFKNNDTRDRIMGMARVKYDFTRWLNIQLRTGTDFYTDRRFAMIPQGTPGLNYIDGQVKNTTWNVREENSDVLLTASGGLAKNLTGSLSMGANHLNKEREVLEVRGQNLSVPGVYHIRYASQVFPRNYLERKKINSVYFAGQLAYKNYLFVDVTGRNDWSSTLGLKDQSFFYPSVTSGFVFTDALGMNSGILSFGKLRASYAQAGNDAGPYQTKAGYTYSEVSFNGLPMAQIDSRIPLLDLKNELTTSYEFGTDLRFFRNRLAVDFTYYDQSTSNQIINIGVTDATGFSTRTINAGEIQNKGMELLVNATVVKAGDFAWDMTLNLARNRSKVVSLAEGIETLSLGTKIEARAGEAYGNIIGYRVLRNSAGQVVVNPKNGQVQKGKQPEILGNIQPDALGGLTNTFTYKGISVSALLDIRIGGEIYSNSKYDQMAKGTGKFTENRDPDHMIIDGVVEDAGGDIVVDGVTYRKNDMKLLAQSFYAGSGPWGGIDEPMVLGADYLTLREVTIGYVLPSAILKYTPFASAKLSIVGRNLFYLYRDPEFKEMGISPETAFNTEAYAQGYETAGLPTTRSFGFNLNLSF
jgi:TonB-linked SusC/RagA family outer membrane protein